MKKAKFNCYFSKIKQENFPKVMNLYVIVNYKRHRSLQSNDNNSETIKSICNLVDNDIKNQAKYECEFETNGEEILNVKSLDTLELNSQKGEILSSSFLHLLVKNNIQNVQEDIFNKPLYFLEDSIVNNNEKEFNITGSLTEDEFNYNNLLLQFHSDKNNSSVIKSNCGIIKSNEKKVILSCIPDNPINTTIIDGYSNLGDANLFVSFNQEKNKIEMKSNNGGPIGGNYGKSSKGISTGVILAIIISICAIIIAVTIVAIRCRKSKKFEDKNITDKNSVDKKGDISENNLNTNSTAN